MKLDLKLSPAVAKRLRLFVFYPLYFSTCLFSFAYCTFPYDRVRDRVEEEVERAMPGSQLEIVDLSPSWLTGVSASGVRLRLPNRTPDDVPAEITLTRASARVHLLSTLFGTRTVSLSGELGGGGTIDATLSDSASATRLIAHLDQVALGRIGPLRRYVPLPIAGSLSGDIDVTIADEVPQTTGTINLTVAGASIGDGRARLSIPGLPGNGLTIEQLNLGDVTARVVVERGVGRIQQLGSVSEDVEIRGAGTVRLVRPIPMSSLDLLLRFDIRQPYRERNDRTRAIFEMVGMSPEVRAFRTAEGAFQIRVSGSFGGSARALPAGSASLPQ